MKKNEITELRKKTEGELAKEVAALTTKIAEAKLKLKRGELKDLHVTTNLRRSMVVIKTILKEKSMQKEIA